MVLGKTTTFPTLAVTDIARAKAFYGGILGLDEVHSFMPDGSDVLYSSGDSSYVYLYERTEPSGSTATACAFSVEDVEQAVATLAMRGVTFEEYDIPELGLKTVNGVANVAGVKNAWFRDPFGNILGIDDSLAVLAQRKSE